VTSTHFSQSIPIFYLPLFWYISNLRCPLFSVPPNFQPDLAELSWPTPQWWLWSIEILLRDRD
jgi:hypothetical protein